MSNLLLKRIFASSTYTIGRLFIVHPNGRQEFICDTLEDCDRGLTNDMPIQDVLQRKIKCQTAIPYGTYKVTLNVTSPSFGKKPYYHNFCQGKLPRLLNVIGFEGILIHRGVDESHSCGCILVGTNKYKGHLSDSQKAFETLYDKLKQYGMDNTSITIEKAY